MNFYAEYQPPAEYDSDRMDEVEARWALLKLKRWERVAARSEELVSGPEPMSPEIACRIRRLRRTYQEAVGVTPDERSDLRQWLAGFLPLDKRPESLTADGTDAGLL